MPLAAFERLLGSDHVRAIDGENLDGAPISGEIRPGTPEQVAACLRIASEEKQAVVACGGRSKLGWGNRPETGPLVLLSLVGLEHPYDLDADEGIVTTGVGVGVAQLREDAAAAGKRTLLDGPHAGATVGGTVAADPVCAGVAPDRRLRNDLLGIQVALPSGSLSRAGGRVVKNVSGYDLVRLQCGAHGTLGVITEVTLRLRPIPEARSVFARTLPSIEEAFHRAGELLESRVEPAGAAIHFGHGHCSLLWVLEGSEADVRGRAGRFEGESVEAGAWDEVDRSLVSAPPEGNARVRLLGRASDTETLCSRLEGAGGTPVVGLPLLGLVFGDLPEEVVPQLVGAAQESGTPVFVEQASPELKGRLDVFGLLPDTLSLMRALKARFDPARVLSPGRFVGRI